MEMPEHVQPCTTSPIVQLALCQHPKQCGLASICTPHHCHTHLYVVLVIWDLQQQHENWFKKASTDKTKVITEKRLP
jgi:hypothetical protein